MLERLDEIDWYSLGHAYGDASDVPRMIRSLTSPEQEVRDQAWDDLIGSVRHQGSMYTSTPVVVPFLIELLNDPSVPGKTELLEGLCVWSPDYGYWPLYEGEEFHQPDEYTLQTRQAIEEAFPSYVRLLEHDEAAIRRKVARVLTLCFSARDSAAQAIRERFPRENSALVRLDWVLQLGIFNRPADARFFAEVARRDSNPTVRLAGALAWVRVKSDKPPAEAVQIIEQSAETPKNLFANLPQHDVEWVVIRAFEALDNKPNSKVRILRTLLHSPSETVCRWAMNTLGWMKPCPPQAIQAIVAVFADKRVQVRLWAAYLLRGDGLFQVGPEAAVAIPKLGDHLTKEPNREVRDVICQVFQNFALWASPSVPALEAIAKNHPKAREALQLIDQLQRADVKELFSLLEKFSSKETITRMIGSVLVSLGQKKPVEVVPSLIRLLGSFPAAAERAAKLLGELGAAGREAVPALRQSLKHASEQVRKAAAGALTAIQPQESELQKPTTEAQIRKQLGKSASPHLVKLIKDLVNDLKTRGQRNALWELAQLGEAARAALPFVQEAMEKKWLHHFAAGALARIDPDRIRPMIPELLKDFAQAKLDGDFEGDSALFLAFLGPDLQPEAIRFLLQCLPAKNGRPKPAAFMIPSSLQYLVTAQPEVLLPLILRLLEMRWEDRDKAESIRSVLKFLKQRGAGFAPAVQAVAAHLKDTSQAPLALETLSRIGSWAAVLPHLGKSLASSNAQIREAARACLGKLGRSATAEDIASLRKAVRHQSAAVQRAAKAALKRLRTN